MLGMIWEARPAAATILGPVRLARADQTSVTITKTKRTAPHPLLSAALRADPQSAPWSFQRASRQLRRHQQWAQQQAATGAPAERVRRVHEYVHRRVLRGDYDASCARLDRTLESGDYNCLTATLLYLDLCRVSGTDVRALASPNHVRIVWQAAGTSRAIETTDPRWQPEALRADEFPITDRQLVARVYYNLGIEYAKREEYAAAESLTRTGWSLDPTLDDARENWLATLNNWSVRLIHRGQFVQARQLIERGLQVDQQYVPLRRAQQYLSRHSL